MIKTSRKWGFWSLFCPFLHQNLIFLTPMVVPIIQRPSGSGYATRYCVLDNTDRFQQRNEANFFIIFLCPVIQEMKSEEENDTSEISFDQKIAQPKTLSSCFQMIICQYFPIVKNLRITFKFCKKYEVLGYFWLISTLKPHFLDENCCKKYSSAKNWYMCYLGSLTWVPYFKILRLNKWFSTCVFLHETMSRL